MQGYWGLPERNATAFLVDDDDDLRQRDVDAGRQREAARPERAAVTKRADPGYHQAMYEMWKEIRESNQPPNSYNTKILKVS